MRYVGISFGRRPFVPRVRPAEVTARLLFERGELYAVLVVVRSVFGPRYIAMAAAITGVMLFGMLVLSEFLFLEPYVIGHVPPGTEAGFALIVAIAILSGLVIPMNVYWMARVRDGRARAGGGVLGSLLGTAAGACSCGPAGIAIISTFGGAGGAATSFLTNYEIPVRAAALAVLVLAMYTTGRLLNARCSLE